MFCSKICVTLLFSSSTEKYYTIPQGTMPSRQKGLKPKGMAKVFFILLIVTMLKTMFLLVRQVELVDLLVTRRSKDQDVTGRYLWAEPPKRGIRGVHRRRSNRVLLCDLPDEILPTNFPQLIWINSCYMDYLRFTFPNSKRMLFLLNYLSKQKHMMRFYVNSPLRFSGISQISSGEMVPVVHILGICLPNCQSW